MTNSWLISYLFSFLPSMFFGKIGFASALLFFGKKFFPVFLSVTGGACIGSVIFTFLSKKLFSWWNKKFPYKLTSSKIKKIRKILKIKRRFGLEGIALISPVLLSYPGGCFISTKFFKNNLKIILYMTLSATFWTIVFYSFVDFLF